MCFMHRKRCTKRSQDFVGLFRPMFVVVWNIVSYDYVYSLGVYAPPPPPPLTQKNSCLRLNYLIRFFIDISMNIETDFPKVVALPWIAGFNVAYLIRLACCSRLLEGLQCDRPFRLGSLKLEMRTKHKVRVLRTCSLMQCFAIFLVPRTSYKSCSWLVTSPLCDPILV
jgi:hypothetical protein